MNSPFPSSSSNDPFGTGSIIGDSPSNRFGRWLAIVLVLAAIGGLGFWASQQFLGDDDDDDVSSVVTTFAPVATDVPTDTQAPDTDDGPAPTVVEPAPTLAPDTTGAPVVPETTVPEAPPTTEVFNPDTFFDGAAARFVLADVASEFGEPFRLVEVVLYPEYVILQAQVTEEPDFVDRVVWRRGAIESRDPVRLTPDTDLNVLLFSIDDVVWEAVNGLVAAAPELTEVRDGEVTHVIVHRPLPFSTDLRFRVFVNSPRSSGFIDATADGTVTQVSTG